MIPADLLPGRDAWPQHASRLVDLQHPLREGRTLRYELTPWRRLFSSRHMLGRRLKARTRYADDWLAARLWVNGNGYDHELRFMVYPPQLTGDIGRTFRARECPPDRIPLHGAANDYQHTPGLVLAPNRPGVDHLRGINSRGIFAFTTDDVLAVMRWADELIGRWYPEEGS